MIKDFDKMFAGVLESGNNNDYRKSTKYERNPFEDIMDFDVKAEKSKVGKEKFEDVLTVL